MTSNSDQVNDDPRLSSEERSLYALGAYFLVAFFVMRFVTERFMPEYFASGATGFTVVLGAWFADRSKRVRISLPKWIVVSIAAGLTSALIAFAFDRLWPAG
ncbi:MAG: hypothetical protein ACYC7A_06205 [Thermoanaerobaculia bacterium]